MRRAVPFALCTLVSVALLGFALRTGVDALTTDPNDVEGFTGWQVDATRWGLVGLAAVLGLGAAVAARRRARLLEGEGVLLGVPLLLGGLLLSGLPSQGLGPALEKAASYTDEARAWDAEVARYRAEEKLHPVAVDFHKPAAPAALAALLPTVGELGTGWYDGQRPAASQSTLPGRVVASTLLVKASRIPDGWNTDRLLRVQLAQWDSPEGADGWLRDFERASSGAGHVDRRVGRVLFRVTAGSAQPRSAFVAVVHRGSRIWTIGLSDGQPATPLTEAEETSVLEVMARHIPAA